MAVLGPVISATEVRFRLRLAGDDIRAVHLCQGLRRPRVGPALTRDSRTQVWEARLPHPPVDRLEYQFEVEHADGTRERIPDPHNPARAAGPLGEMSVVELPGYRPPAWTERPVALRDRIIELSIPSDVLEARVHIGLWSAPGLDVEHPAPLLLVHDGPDYARYCDLLRFLTIMVADGRLPLLRTALLTPVDRDEHYAACPRYARALARELLPVIDWLAPQPPRRYDGRSWRVGMGASLGALAMLHVHRRYPDVFGGLFLQSGSFFQRHTDPQEAAFRRFDRITRFVKTVTDAATARHPVPVMMTCGTVEENLANNRRMRDALRLQGYDVDLAVHRDAHNWISWRDVLDPHLVDLLQICWRDA